MAWYQDLQPFDADGASFLRAVGWLDRNKPFSQGVCDARVIQRLIELQEKRGGFPLLGTRGWHDCTLCADGSADGRSYYEMFVPGDGVIYVCPEGIVHYVRQHKYLPPGEFINALV